MSTLQDLDTHLFSQMQRLDNADLCGDNLEKEIERTEALTKISKSIVESATLQLNAVKLKAEYLGLKKGEMPALLEGGKP